MFNLDRAFFEDQTPKLISSAKRSLQDRQRDIYDSHRHRVYAVAYYMIGNELAAEETLTQTFVRAFQIAEEPDAKTVDAVLMGELRAQLGFDEPAPFMEVTTEGSNGSRNIRRTDLEEAIQQLPPMERLVFLLKDVEGYSTAAIGDFVSLPAADLPRILLSARLRLRSILASGISAKPSFQGDDPSSASAAA
ncbi:MAG TPA: sigma factor-like helix-turn-helix DNA-binding protein [Acidisarcina sp.]|nr:sigma factor-like helix-turn-helix DNA-binding protein [Acidisarcina sp.]